MIVKSVVVLALMTLMLPNEPDLGMAKPAVAPAELECVRVVMLEALDRVQADISAHRIGRRELPFS